MTKTEINNQRLVLVFSALIVCGLFLYALRSILLPFAVGILAAYFLDPLVNKLTKRKLSRNSASLLVLGCLLVIFIPLLIFLGGVIVSQIADMSVKIPNYVNAFVHRILPVLQDLQEKFVFFSSTNTEEFLQKHTTDTFRIVGKILNGLINESFAFINIMSLLLISPVVAFYMLSDWPKITSGFMKLIPVKHQKSLSDVFEQINKIISGYLRGQFVVCLFLGAFYSCGLVLIGLDLGLMVGFMAGLISFIPYVGSISGFLTAIILALVQYGAGIELAEVVAIFAVGQFIEGNFLTPKLVGENIGLHPVWVMFALLSGGVLLGFLGMLVAVPVAAIIGVLLKILIKNYQKSRIYLEK